jgi:hypothetical protein
MPTRAALKRLASARERADPDGRDVHLRVTGPFGAAIRVHMTPCILGLVAVATALIVGCASKGHRAETQAASQPASRPYDTTIPRAMAPRDALERLALERGVDFRLIDRLMDEQTKSPAFARQPLPPMRPDAGISDNVGLIDEGDPFPATEIVPAKEPGINVGLGRSTFRTHTPEEVLAAVVPFQDLEQREVDVRPNIALFE